MEHRPTTGLLFVLARGLHQTKVVTFDVRVDVALGWIQYFVPLLSAMCNGSAQTRGWKNVVDDVTLLRILNSLLAHYLVNKFCVSGGARFCKRCVYPHHMYIRAREWSAQQSITLRNLDLKDALSYLSGRSDLIRQLGPIMPTGLDKGADKAFITFKKKDNMQATIYQVECYIDKIREEVRETLP